MDFLALEVGVACQGRWWGKEAADGKPNTDMQKCESEQSEHNSSGF